MKCSICDLSFHCCPSCGFEDYFEAECCYGCFEKYNIDGLFWAYYTAKEAFDQAVIDARKQEIPNG